MPECSYSDCAERATSRGMCQRHYGLNYRARKRRENGYADRMGKARRKLEEIRTGEHGDKCETWPYARDASGFAVIAARHNYGDNDTRYRKPERVCDLLRDDLVEGPQMTPELRQRGLVLWVDYTCGGARDGCVNPRHMVRKLARAGQVPRVSQPAPVLHWSLALVERIAEMSLVSDPVDIFRELTKPCN